MSDAISAGNPPDERAERAIETARAWTQQAGELAKRAAQRVPAGVVVVVGGAALLVTDAFGVGEVVTAGIAAYAAYRLLRKRRGDRVERADRANGGTQEARIVEAQP